jgi:hypothetical protein
LPQTFIIAALFFAAAGVGVLALFGARLFLPWYLKEIRRVPIPQDPEDAIVTYPLA